MGKDNIAIEALLFVTVIVLVCLEVFFAGVFHQIESMLNDSLATTDKATILSAAATTLSAAATSFAAYTTAFIAYLTFKSNKRAKESAIKTQQLTEKLEREKLRPRVVFDFVYNEEHRHIYAEIRNEGLTSARNITFKIPPEIIEDGKHGDKYEFPYKYPIPFLSPNSAKSSLLTQSDKFFEKHKDPQFTIKAFYEDTIGTKYSETIVHDLTYLKNTVTWKGPPPPWENP